MTPSVLTERLHAFRTQLTRRLTDRGFVLIAADVGRDKDVSSGFSRFAWFLTLRLPNGNLQTAHAVIPSHQDPYGELAARDVAARVFAFTPAGGDLDAARRT